ncbi:MAG: hypothetical protein OEU84_13810, partial [Xanthomonadales bacterium]|nr:hypothetical protein [Xanthomonadales bacterium]
MTNENNHKPASTEPVMYVHAKGRGKIRPDSAQRLLETGLPVCSHLEHEGLIQTENGYDQPGLLVAELARRFPGRPVIFLRAGLQPSRQLLDNLKSLLDQVDQPVALTLLSNASINPFAGLRTTGGKLNYDPAELVKLLAPGQLHTLTTWTDHFVLLSADLVEHLSEDGSDAALMHRVHAAGGSLMVPDHLFLHDTESRLFTSIKLQPHESAYPPPFSELSSRIQQWFNAGIENLPSLPDDDKPATLHITHSWGGGVAQWLKSFIETDHKQPNFQLRSENPQSGLGYGQKLSLYAGNELRCPIASWWLTPPIESITDSYTGYQDILTGICGRYGIGRVFVSSLVGHSIDALRSRLPTLQILHDHFPVWPLLSVNPQPYLQHGDAPNLKLALGEHVRAQEFPDKDAQAWSLIHDAYLQALKENQVKVVAPGQSVLDLQNQLEPAFKTLPARVI